MFLKDFEKIANETFTEIKPAINNFLHTSLLTLLQRRKQNPKNKLFSIPTTNNNIRYRYLTPNYWGPH